MKPRVNQLHVAVCTLICSACLLFGFANLACFGQTLSDMVTLGKLEQEVFGSEDHQSSLEDRLKKLEIKILGRARSGPFSQRMNAVAKACKTGAFKSSTGSSSTAGSSTASPSTAYPRSQSSQSWQGKQIATNSWDRSPGSKTNSYGSQSGKQYSNAGSSYGAKANIGGSSRGWATGNSLSPARGKDLYLDTGDSQKPASQRPDQGHTDDREVKPYQAPTQTHAQDNSATEVRPIASSENENKSDVSDTSSSRERERKTARVSSESSDEEQRPKRSGTRLQTPDIHAVASAAKKFAKFLPLVSSVPVIGSIAAPVASAVGQNYERMNASEILRQIQSSGAPPADSESSTGGQSSPRPARERRAVDRPIQDKWALVIGISKFQDQSVPQLRYAAKDAQDFANFLTTDGGFAKDHVRLLLNQDATFRRVLTELGDKFLPRAARSNDLVVVYFSGHGSPGSADVRGKSYLVVYDTDKSNLYSSGIEIQGLAQVIKERVMSDRVCLILDACHSGAAKAGGKSGFDEVDFKGADVFQGTGQLVICSSSAGERSWESRRYNNGVFTKNLIKAFKSQGAGGGLGSAFQSMKESVVDEVREDEGVTQTPVLKSDWNGTGLRFCAPPAEPRPLPQTVKELLQADSKSKS